MCNKEQVGELIDAANVAGSDQTRWPVFLDRLARLLNAPITAFHVHDTEATTAGTDAVIVVP